MSLKLSYIKNCPTLNYKSASKDLQQHDLNFTDKFYKNFQTFMLANPGKTTKELIELLYTNNIYDFTEETLIIAFKLFNTYKNTFYNTCGPFIYKNNRWFPVYSKKYTDTILLAQENSILRNKFKILQDKYAKLLESKI